MDVGGIDKGRAGDHAHVTRPIMILAGWACYAICYDCNILDWMYLQARQVRATGRLLAGTAPTGAPRVLVLRVVERSWCSFACEGRRIAGMVCMRPFHHIRFPGPVRLPGEALACSHLPACSVSVMIMSWQQRCNCVRLSISRSSLTFRWQEELALVSR